MPDLLLRDPFVGPTPFGRGDAWRFFGRGDVTDELFSLLTASRTLILHSQSGAGKSSLVNAGLLPLAEEEGFDVLPTARVQGVVPVGTPTGGITNPYTFFTLASWEWMGYGTEWRPSSIAEALRVCPRRVGRFGEPAPRLIVLDQFEELFTTYPDHWQDRSRYLEDIAEALRDDPGLRVLFCLREEYLADMLSMAKVLPDRGRSRFRLSRLRYEEAAEAIRAPVEAAGRSFATGVVEQLVEDLMRIRVETAPGTATEVQGEFVEPVQLQVVCSSLWGSLPPETTEITSEHVRSFGDVTTALARFYDDAVAHTAQATGVPAAGVRHWFETQLITPANTRSMAYRGARSTAGLDNRSVDVLESHHMIRAELRAGSRWYELTHDRFVAPIQASNAREREVEAAARVRPRGVVPRPWGVVPLLVAIVAIILLVGIGSDQGPLEAASWIAVGLLAGIGSAQLATVGLEWFLWENRWWSWRWRWIAAPPVALLGLIFSLGGLYGLGASVEEAATVSFGQFVRDLDPDIVAPGEPNCGGSTLRVFIDRPTPVLSGVNRATPAQRARLKRRAEMWCADEASTNLIWATGLMAFSAAAFFLAARELSRLRRRRPPPV